MLKRELLLCICVFITAIGIAQDLYKPRDIKQAIKNNTLTTTGQPSENYWQNTVNYAIKVKLSPPDRTIHGSNYLYQS